MSNDGTHLQSAVCKAGMERLVRGERRAEQSEERNVGRFEAAGRSRSVESLVVRGNAGWWRAVVFDTYNSTNSRKDDDYQQR